MKRARTYGLSAHVGARRRCMRCVLVAGLAACATAGAAPRNLSFEDGARAGTAEPPGWQLRSRGDATVAADSQAVRHGSSSLRVDLAGDDARLRLTQRVDTAGMAGNRIRISAHVRAEALDDGGASLSVRVDGGGMLLFVDRGRELSMGSDDAGWRRVTIQAPLAADAERVTFGASLDGRGRAWLDDFRVETYDTAELPPASAAATRYVEYALALMRRHSLVRGRIDWDELRTATFAQARGADTFADTHLALQFALTSLGDDHSYFMPPDRMEQLDLEPASNARTGRPAVEALSKPLGERLAYLRVPGYAGGSQADQVAYAEDLQGRIEALDAPARCGWVVDLRGNNGGNLWPMLAGLGPLLGDGEAGAAVHPDDERESIAYRDGKVSLDDRVQLRLRRDAYRVEKPSAPVAVLVDGRTASSGEIIAMFLNARAGSRSFGAPTRGVATATQTFPLADGAALILTVAATSDKHGRVASGPIEPDVAVEAAPEPSPAESEAPLLAAIDWITNRYGCW